MPPSGYSHKQVKYITRFLKSCSEALLIEAKENQETALEALAREILDIRSELQRRDNPVFCEEVLRLTKKFYQMVLDSKPITFTEYVREVDAVLNEIEVTILGIHIITKGRAA